VAKQQTGMMQAASKTNFLSISADSMAVYLRRTVRTPAVRTSDPKDIQQFGRKYKHTLTMTAKAHFEFGLVFDRIDRNWVRVLIKI
jgi:hypothetical protein